MALDPACLFGCTPLTVGQFGRSAPKSQRLVEAGRRLADVSSGDRVATPLGDRLVMRGIDLGRAQGPAGAHRQHEAVSQGATQSGDVGLKGLRGGARGVLAPEQVYQ